MKRLLIFFLIPVYFLFAFVPLVAVADESEVLIELSENDYKAYIESELSKPVTYAVGDDLITTKTYESTNTPKKSGAGSIGSAITTGVLDFGKQIFVDIINNSVIENEDSGLKIPDFRQQIGKCRVVYSSGLVEILTCSLTTYSTQVIGTLGKPTGEYKSHAIITFIRETDSRYTVTTVCDEESMQYCDSYSTVGTFSFSTYTPYSTTYTSRFFDYDTQDVVISPRVQLLGQRYTNILFKDLEQIEEINQSTLDIKNLFFGTATRQGLPEINAGYQYKPLYSLVSTANMYSGVTGGTSLQGLCLATANTITNSYSDYIQMKDIEDTPDREQKQSITYISELNSTNIYNENTVENYDFLTYEGDKITTNKNFNNFFNAFVVAPITLNANATFKIYWELPDIELPEPSVTLPNIPDPTNTPNPPDQPDPTEPTQPSDPTEPIQPPDTIPPATCPATCPVATLPTETYRIPDFETDTYVLEIDTLPAVEYLPEEIVVGGNFILDQSTDILDKFGILSLYMTLGVVSIVVFVLKGAK